MKYRTLLSMYSTKMHTHHSQLFKKSISTFSSHYYLEEVCSKLLPVFTTFSFGPFFTFEFSKAEFIISNVFERNSLLSHPRWCVFKIIFKRIPWPSFILFIWHHIFDLPYVPFTSRNNLTTFKLCITAIY